MSRVERQFNNKAQSSVNIRLRTWQGPEHSIIAGSVDKTKSEWWENPEIRSAYEQLFFRVGTDQFLWCSCGGFDKPWRGRVPWDLLVPRECIIKFVDARMWNVIIGRTFAIPEQLWLQWNRESRKSVGTDESRRNEWLKQRESEYIECHSVADPWSHLFIDYDLNLGDCLSALVAHPVQADWIIAERGLYDPPEGM
jgi:hypothetical protein